MPVAAPAAPVDTLLPGAIRRRVWHAPAVLSHSLLTLTPTKLYLAPAGALPKAETVAAILEGADLDKTFGPLAVAIDLRAVSRLRLDLTTNAVTIVYNPMFGRNGSGVVGRTPRAEVVIACADHATGDELFTKLWRRLGQTFELKRLGSAPPGAARRPVAIMAGVLAATLAITLASTVAADLTDPPALLAPFASLDWRAVCGLGGAVLAGLQLWLYRRLTKPPTALELTARN